MNIFSYIKSKIQIMDVVSEYTSLKRAGNYWKGQCPFHNEKTASFTVSPHKEIFYCFGCHAGGDVIAFISKIENFSQIEAARHLAKTYNIELPDELTKEIAGQKHEKEKYFMLCEEVANWCHNQLMINEQALKYMQKRGFNKNIIESYNLGYFPPTYLSVRALINHLNKFSLMQSDLIEAKIIAEGKKATFSPFEDRIIFPIKDIIGRYCGFGGRIFKEFDQRPKYYNSHETPYFAKGSLLFGFDAAKKALSKCDHIFIVEGYTDCITMAQYGFKNTVATLGTACTQEHLKILSRYVNYVYVLYDGDNAGQNAIMRLTELCWQVSIELKVITLPETEDPASFLQNGGNLNELIDQARDIFMFFIENTCKDFLSKPLAEKLKLANEIIKTIEKIQDPIKRDILMQKASNIMQIPINSMLGNTNSDFKYNNSNSYNKQNLYDNSGLYNKQNKYNNNSGQYNKQNGYKNYNNSGSYKQQNEYTRQNNYNNQSNDAQNFSNKDYNNQTANKYNGVTQVKNLKEDLKLEKKIFFAIINNKDFITDEVSELLLQYLPEPINGIFKDYLINGSGHNFVSFFETLKEENKNYISKLLLEFEETIDKKTFDQLFLQFQKKHWKNIVKKIQDNLEIAKKESDEKKLSEILDKFSQLKQKMLKS